MGDPQVFWLNLTNAVLGIGVAAGLLTVAIALVCEVILKVRMKLALRQSCFIAPPAPERRASRATSRGVIFRNWPSSIRARLNGPVSG